MKKNIVPKSYKKLARSQKRLKKAFKKLGAKAKNKENPAWVTALAAVAGAITTALTDSGKRSQLVDIAVDAKKKATNLLTSPKESSEEDVEHEHPHHHEEARH
jgi:hypothetical protein